jgi:ABC-type glutathione transport system ATPase component
MKPTNEILSAEDFAAREPVPLVKYKSKKETLSPGNSYFELDHKTANRALTGINNKVYVAIDDANVGNNQDLAAHRRTASNIERIEYSPGKTIAFIGAMGAGKSTLMNEILCIDHLCETSSGQVACTQVAVSYHHYETAGQTLDKSEVRAEVDLMEDRDFNVLRSTFRSEIEDEYQEDGTEAHSGEMAATAQANAYLTALHDLAGRTDEFDPTEATSKTAISTNDARALKRQFDIFSEAAVSRAIRDHGDTDRKLVFHCKDMPSLHKKLRAYAIGERTCVVKSIRVYVQGTVLKYGCALVDLPGMQYKIVQ